MSPDIRGAAGCERGLQEGRSLGMPGQAVDQPGNPEKAPQRLENIQFAPGNGMAPAALDPKYLVGGARAAKRRLARILRLFYASRQHGGLDQRIQRPQRRCAAAPPGRRASTGRLLRCRTARSDGPAADAGRTSRTGLSPTTEPGSQAPL